MSFVNICETTDCVITALHCINPIILMSPSITYYCPSPSPACPIHVPVLDASRVTVQGEMRNVAVNRYSSFKVQTQQAGEADLTVRVTCELSWQWGWGKMLVCMMTSACVLQDQPHFLIDRFIFHDEFFKESFNEIFVMIIRYCTSMNSRTFQCICIDIL